MELPSSIQIKEPTQEAMKTQMAELLKWASREIEDYRECLKGRGIPVGIHNKMLSGIDTALAAYESESNETGSTQVEPPRLSDKIGHINRDPEALKDPDFVNALNYMAELAYEKDSKVEPPKAEAGEVEQAKLGKAVVDYAIMEEFKSKFKKIQDQHQYKVAGNPDSYSDYNQGWSDALDLAEQLFDEYASQFKPEWISVEDRLPERGQRILVYRGNIEGRLIESTMVDNDFFIFFDWNGVTHWQPLPEPPITEELKTKQP